MTNTEKGYCGVRLRSTVRRVLQSETDGKVLWSDTVRRVLQSDTVRRVLQSDTEKYAIGFNIGRVLDWKGMQKLARCWILKSTVVRF